MELKYKTPFFYSKIVLFLLFYGIATSCRTETNTEKVNKTINTVAELIANKDYVGIKDMIYPISESDTDLGMLTYQVKNISYFINKYHNGSLKGITPKYYKSLDRSGRRAIFFELFKGLDSATGTKEAYLYLYVGPPEYVPLTRLSGFEFQSELDLEWRTKLMNENRLINIDSLNK